jgi:gamma-glutamylcyclotransferase (GGCT)/AIG2-like uncharacterized protein YtfP
MRLFFYGTLMSGHHRAHALHGLARPVAEGTVRGNLYSVGYGAFPALMAGEGVVHGEVWEVLPGCEGQALHITDMIEGYREDDPFSMYVREEVPLLEATGAAHAGDTVQVYRWNSEVPGERIESGSWRVYTGANDLAASGR